MLRRSTVCVARKNVSRFMAAPSEAKSFAATLDFCKTHNIDAASSYTRDFCFLQARLMPYRIARLGREMRFAAQNPMDALPGFSRLVCHVLVLTLVFAAARRAGRLSMAPLTAPEVDAPTTPTTPVVAEEESA